MLTELLFFNGYYICGQLFLQVNIIIETEASVNEVYILSRVIHGSRTNKYFKFLTFTTDVMHTLTEN